MEWTILMITIPVCSESPAMHHSEYYYVGLWSTNLVDTDKAYSNTLRECAKTPKCPLYFPDQTAEQLYDRIKAILDGLDSRPLSIIAPTEGGKLNYGIVDRDLARQKLFTALYKPRRDMLPWFEAVRDLERGNGTKMLSISDKTDALFRCDCGSNDGNGNGNDGKRAFEIRIETETAIACSDADVVRQDVGLLKEVHEGLRKDSEFAEFWLVSLMCR